MHAPEDAPDQRAAVRRPYVAPAIEETSDFDTLALACTHTVIGCQPDDPGEPGLEPSS